MRDNLNFSQSAPGASRMELEEEEEEEVDEGEPKPPKNSQNLFPVCGTLLNPDTTPAFPVEIVKNEDGAIQTAIMASDIIIYSIAEGEYTQEAQTALDFLQQVKHSVLLWKSDYKAEEIPSFKIKRLTLNLIKIYS